MSVYRRHPSVSEPVTVVEEEGFDGLLSALGFGKWQIIVLLLPFFAMMLYPLHLLGASFLTAPVPFRCSIGQMDICDGYGETCRNNSSSNYLSDKNESYYNSRCLNLTIHQLIDDNLNLTETQRRTTLGSCPVIEYDTSVFSSTVFSEWNLVCERSYLRPLFVTLCTIGNMFGSILGGYAGDRWGRLLAVKIGSVVNILVIAAMVTVPSYPLLLVTRFIAGCSVAATLIPAWSLGIESTPSRYRSLVGMYLGLPFSVFLIEYAGVAYLIRNWKYLLLAGASSSLLLLPCSFIATESPRWLLNMGRQEEATKVLEKARKLNGAILDSPISFYVGRLILNANTDTPAAPENQSCWMSVMASLRRGLTYLRSPAMRTIIICIGGIWFLHFLLFIGIALNANNFARENPFLYVALTGIMDTSAILCFTPLTSFFGRRVFLLAGYVIGGILFFLELIVPPGYDWIRWVMVMAGFFLVAGSLQVNFLYAPEVFPTEIRARGFAYVQLMGSLGSSVAPFITDVLSQYSWWAPGVTFGCAGILGGLLVPFLPETRDKPLPETVQDIEDACKKAKDKKQLLQGVENKSYTEDVDSHT